MSKNQIKRKLVKRKTLAEQMAETIKEMILNEEIQSGESLPPEPEMAEQFEVSRAVVRDATRILMAWGLVEVKHGKGVFVTEPQNNAFGEALLLALIRNKATVWDIEQFEWVVFPEVVGLASLMATEEEIDTLYTMAEDYETHFRVFSERWWQVKEVPGEEAEAILNKFRSLKKKVYAATHNQLFQQLAEPLTSLRNFRNVQNQEGQTVDDFVKLERQWMDKLLEAISSRDQKRAREIAFELMIIPEKAVDIMQQTPIGKVVDIPPGLIWGSSQNEVK
ncbi:MAG: FadR family transcriptional regulator [Anaerolineaceae bacterium]|nr:FadR family transcriptional regulator [Anaerolineaceae bacterium]